MNRKKSMPTATPPAASGLSFRSGAVARMANMPVATLRIWEQRYQAVRLTSAASGRRLYSLADVQRVQLLRQLTGQGYAIGSIAGLDSTQLQEVARAHAYAPAGPRSARRAAALRLVVVGQALAARLQRPLVAQRLSRPAQVVAVFDSLVEAARAGSGTGTDVLVWQSPGLQAGVPPEFEAAQAAWRVRRVAVVYRFVGAAARKAFADAGAVMLREPPDDEVLGAWLASLETSLAAGAAEPDPRRERRTAAGPSAAAVVPRRFDDAALTAIAGLTPTLACECPRHVAELLMQIASFEDYSAACVSRSPADAELHVHLQQVAGASRALFESALERVARHEGLKLP